MKVWIPGLGVREGDALRMRERSIVRDGDRAIAVTTLASSAVGTEVAVEIKDDVRADGCIAGKFDYHALDRMSVGVRDERGREYAPSKTLLGSLGIGQHEFGFFRREVGFETLDAATRRVEVRVAGELGDWSVPVEVAPVTETDAVPIRALDESATREDVTVRLTGIGLGATETIVTLQAEPNTPGVVVRAIGAVMQRQGDDRLVLVDSAGTRHVEELARETTQRHQHDGTKALAKFAALPADAGEMTLVIPAVILEEEGSVDIELPFAGPRDVEIGAHPMTISTAGFVDDAPTPPGEAPRTALRIAVSPRYLDRPRRLVRPMTIAVDGVERRGGTGFGFHPVPGFTNLTIDIGPEAAPKVITLSRPMVRVAGPWEIRFRI